jgi:hypothetical protein
MFDANNPKPKENTNNKKMKNKKKKEMLLCTGVSLDIYDVYEVCPSCGGLRADFLRSSAIVSMARTLSSRTGFVKTLQKR